MVHIIEDEDGAPLPEALQFESPLWELTYSVLCIAAADYGPPLSSTQVVERTDEAMRRIAPLCLPVEEPPVSRPMRGGYPG